MVVRAPRYLGSHEPFDSFCWNSERHRGTTGHRGRPAERTVDSHARWRGRPSSTGKRARGSRCAGREEPNGGEQGSQTRGRKSVVWVLGARAVPYSGPFKRLGPSRPGVRTGLRVPKTALRSALAGELDRVPAPREQGPFVTNLFYLLRPEHSGNKTSEVP